MLKSKAGYIDARPLTASSAKPLATHGRTIHQGQTRKSAVAIVRSGLPPKADSTRTSRHVRKVPLPDSCTAASSIFQVQALIPARAFTLDVVVEDTVLYFGT